MKDGHTICATKRVISREVFSRKAYDPEIIREGYISSMIGGNKTKTMTYAGHAI